MFELLEISLNALKQKRKDEICQMVSDYRDSLNKTQKTRSLASLSDLMLTQLSSLLKPLIQDSIQDLLNQLKEAKEQISDANEDPVD